MVKPLALVLDAIKGCSKRKGIILDPLADSVTTILVAEKTGRQARALVQSPGFFGCIDDGWAEVPRS